MNEYQVLADYYDILMGDMDYAGQAEWLLSLFARYRKRPETVLDLACGSGRLCVELAQRGVEMIGVDGSAEMLLKAEENASRQGLDILFLQQDIRELDLYGTVQGAVCMLDSLNHLTKTDDLLTVFRRLSLFVEPGGLLLFDVNTPYKHRCVLGNQTFVLEEENIVCVWRNRLIERNCEVEEWLDFFVQEKDGRYSRYSDTVRERAYSQATLRRLLAQASFTVQAVYDGETGGLPTEETERWLFVAQNEIKK